MVLSSFVVDIVTPWEVPELFLTIMMIDVLENTRIIVNYGAGKFLLMRIMVNSFEFRLGFGNMWYCG